MIHKIAINFQVSRDIENAINIGSKSQINIEVNHGL